MIKGLAGILFIANVQTDGSLKEVVNGRRKSSQRQQDGWIT